MRSRDVRGLPCSDQLKEVIYRCLGVRGKRYAAAGYGPCRLCLDTFRVGADERLLFTYDPFAGLDPYPAPVPIFVHADGCAPFAAPARAASSTKCLTRATL